MQEIDSGPCFSHDSSTQAPRHRALAQREFEFGDHQNAQRSAREWKPATGTGVCRSQRTHLPRYSSWTHSLRVSRAKSPAR